MLKYCTIVQNKLLITNFWTSHLIVQLVQIVQIQ